MVSNRIKTRIEGSVEDNGLVRLSELARILSSLNDILSRLDRKITRITSPSLYFRIVDLKYSSPAIIETEIVPLNPNATHAPAVIDKYLNGLDSIKKGSAPIDFDRGLIESFKGLTHGFKKDKEKRKYINNIQFTSEQITVELSDDIEPEITRILGKDEITYGSETGVLELINIHLGANKFNIYPIIGAEVIGCIFPESLKTKAMAGIGRNVKVMGKLKYRAREKFPYEMVVENIEIFPKDEELPTLFDLKGIAPDATGDLSSVDFIRKIRSE